MAGEDMIQPTLSTQTKTAQIGYRLSGQLVTEIRSNVGIYYQR